VSWRYTGETPGTYPDYLDKATGATLAAVPGEVYDIEPAAGTEYTVPAEQEGGEPTVRTLPVPPAGPWERAKAARPTADASKE
jgi:hypothetical protein